ncbi:hypothetical protein P186_0291 [Pyrobaculum ferrireducens]|uniref:Uncharacterized protein n=1 Tax=Pyrobaculum ferrireducens TaxID=1104324 RepID=G7VFU2_9CREN|nr:hypothetical protein P186_0291 [Pyrobaculum ferrireducens]
MAYSDAGCGAQRSGATAVKKAALVGPALRGAAGGRSLGRRGVSKGRVAGGRFATTGFSPLIFPKPLDICQTVHNIN